MPQEAAGSSRTSCDSWDAFHQQLPLRCLPKQPPAAISPHCNIFILANKCCSISNCPIKANKEASSYFTFSKQKPHGALRGHSKGRAKPEFVATPADTAYVIEPQNHRMVWAGRDLRDQQVPTPLYWLSCSSDSSISARGVFLPS